MRVKSTALFGGVMSLNDDLLEDIAYYCGLSVEETRVKLEAGERLQSKIHPSVKYYKVED